MNSFKKIISVRTPIVMYDKKLEETTNALQQTSENLLNLSIQTKTLVKPSTITLTSITPEPNENRSSIAEKLRKTKKLVKLLHKRPETNHRNLSIDNPTESKEKFFAQISLRYKAHGKSTEVKVLRRNMQSNDALIVERIPTPSNLYLKEIQAFSVSRNRLVRKKKSLSINLFRQKLEK